MSDLLLQRASKLIVFDGFNRADNAESLGNADTGQLAQIVGEKGVWGINDNKAYKVSGTSVVSEGLACWDADNPNVAVSCDITFGSNAGIIARSVETGLGNHLVSRINYAGLILYSITNNVVTALGEYAFAPTMGNIYNLKIIVNGTSIKVVLDGIERISVTSNAHLTNTLYGFRAIDDYVSKFDNLQVEAI